MVPTLPDTSSWLWQLFGLLSKGHSDPHYDTAFQDLGAYDLLCPYRYHDSTRFVLYKGRRKIQELLLSSTTPMFHERQDFSSLRSSK